MYKRCVAARVQVTTTLRLIAPNSITGIPFKIRGCRNLVRICIHCGGGGNVSLIGLRPTQLRSLVYSLHRGNGRLSLSLSLFPLHIIIIHQMINNQTRNKQQKIVELSPCESQWAIIGLALGTACGL